LKIWFGAIQKIRPQSGGREFAHCGHFADGSSDADVSTFWWKNFGFFRNLWCIRTNKGVKPVRTFCDQGTGDQFLDGSFKKVAMLRKLKNALKTVWLTRLYCVRS